MTRINSFLGSGSLTAQAALWKSLREENRSLERLATLQRINRGSDDPAGLIAAAALESELTAIETAEQNASRAEALLSVADSAMSQVGELINTVESSALAAAGDGATDAEKAAYQQQIDAALEAIDRIGNTTQFNGRKLLDGSASSLSFVFSADPANVSTVSLPQTSSSTLGGAAGVLNDLRSGGSASVAADDPGASIDIARQARSQLLSARAEVGAFQKLTVETSREVLSKTGIELTSALSSIRDTDVAAETARLVRSQLLSESALASVRTNGVQARRLAMLLSRAD